MKIGILITCHNRCATTITCLEALSAQNLPQHTELAIYLVDDGCTDQTAETVLKRFPEVRVIPGDGNLYWCGGMRKAWCSAIADADYDCYLWLNDDVRLFREAVGVLVRSWQDAAAAGRPGIILGSTCDPDSDRPTYGGYCGDTMVEPSLEMQTCERMNGNIVLVPRAVLKVVGNLSPDFRQLFGDMDYGFRARTAGFEIWVAPGFLGHCRRNPCPPWDDPSVPFFQRWRSLHSPTAYPPRENYIFCKRHYKWRGLIRILKLYLRMSSPGSWHWLKQISGRNE
jgi:GT2 family glycosyltransferase